MYIECNLKSVTVNMYLVLSGSLEFLIQTDQQEQEKCYKTTTPTALRVFKAFHSHAHLHTRTNINIYAFIFSHTPHFFLSHFKNPLSYSLCLSLCLSPHD